MTDEESRAHDPESDEIEGESPSDRLKRRLAEGILNGLFESGAALRRGKDMVSDAAQATRDEVQRIIGSEIRRFLDSMDIADLAQEIISGLVLDVHTQVKFRRDGDGELRPELTETSSAVTRSDKAQDEDETS